MNQTLKMTKDGIKALFAEALDKGDKAEAAMLEWLCDRVDYGPDMEISHPRECHRGAWRDYCEAKGNCPHAYFDQPLYEALDKAVDWAVAKAGKMELAFPAGGCGTVREFVTEIGRDFDDVLWECHN